MGILSIPGLDLRMARGGPLVHSRWNALLAGWKLDESSDGSGPVSRADVLGVHTLTDNNTVQSVAGKISNAARIDGSVLERLSRSSTAFRSSGDFTLAAWIQSKIGTATGDGNFVHFATEDLVTQDWALYRGAFTSNFTIRIVDSVSGNATTFRTLSLDAWHFIVIVYTASDKIVRLSADGDAFTASVALTNGLRQTGEVFNIGHGGSNQLDWLDEVYFFQVAKDADWVSGMYNGGAGRTHPL